MPPKAVPTNTRSHARKAAAVPLAEFEPSPAILDESSGSLQPPPVTPVRRSQPAPTAAARRHGHVDSESGEEFGTPMASDGEEDEVPLAPARTVTMASPVKKARAVAAQQAGLYLKSDMDVWKETDEKIIDAALGAWTSYVYPHYDVGIRRNYDEDNHPLDMDYVFTCKTHPEHHTGPQYRPRRHTSYGTANLKIHLQKCERLQGLDQSSKSSVPKLEYTPANHRTLIAMRCAKNARPIHTILDDEYRQEVEMLHPGATLPHPTTVACDLVNMYTDLSLFVLSYFANLGSKIHLALDGWTAPIVTSYLGIVVIWYADGKINRAVLEFIRLTKSHTGQYLANVTADCLRRYGLQDLLLGLCMDNASNCNRLASLLPNWIPGFGGDEARLRCIAHIINLVAKIFISFFFKKPKLKHLEDDPPINDADLAAMEEAVLDEQVEQDDDGQIAHDESTVKSLRNDAIQAMEKIGVFMTAEEEETALNIFPKVSGLARRVHDVTTLGERFRELVNADQELQSTKRALARRVPTRWNSDFDCLDSHLHFKPIIQSMTGVSSLKLKAYALNEEQWELSEDLQEVLKLFKDITLLFSQAEVPLIVEALPVLLQLHESMQLVVQDQPADISDDEDDSSDSSEPDRVTPPVIRIAAQAATFLLDKYLAKLWECDIYTIAIVMCPNRKLQWFKDQGLKPDQVKDIKATVINCWKQHYAPSQELQSREKEKEKEKLPKSKSKKSKWAAPLPEAPASKKKKYGYDHIETYLAEPVITTEEIDRAGGYLKYWDTALTTRSSIARMALDYISAPATSVDAERAFSAGRRQLNFMQSNMSSKVFQSRMAVGSWIKTPLFPGIPATSKIISKYMKRSKKTTTQSTTSGVTEWDEDLDPEESELDE